MTNRVILNETSYFGRGSREKVVDEIKARGFKRVLLVTDRSLIEAEVAGMVTAELDKADIPYFIFDGVKPNPNVKNVQDGLTMAKINNVNNKIEIIILLIFYQQISYI